MPEAVYDYRCAKYSATEEFTQASCPAGCFPGISGEDDAYRYYCYCRVSSYEECVQMMPGPEGKGPELNEAVPCGELVAQSLDGATCDTRGEEIYLWAQACCVDKTSICPVAQLCASEDAANFIPDGVIEYTCAELSSQDLSATCSTSRGCMSGWSDDGYYYCSCQLDDPSSENASSECEAALSGEDARGG